MDPTSSTASPDLSPVSTTSVLLTPNDSPAKSFDPKLGGPFDYGQPYHARSNSLLFETGVPSRYLDLAAANDTPSFQYNHLQSEPITFTNPFFEPFSDRPPTAPTAPGLLSLPQSQLRGDTMAQPPWGSQRLRSSSSEWARDEDKSASEPSLASLDGGPAARTYQTSHSHSNHEVRVSH